MNSTALSPNETKAASESEARAALAFAKRHDWGRHAFVDHDAGFFWIDCLRETTVSAIGELRDVYTRRPATLSALRAFGGY